MPVDFLTAEQQRQYGRYPGELSAEQLDRFFYLDDTDLRRIRQKRQPVNQLGFAMQLGTVRFLGTFLPDPTKVPSGVIAYVSRQLDITDPTCLRQYRSRAATRHAHTVEICTSYGYHDFNEPPWRFRLTRMLYSRAWVNEERPSLLFDLATAWLAERKVLLPGVTTLMRLVSRVRDRVARRLWKQLAGLPSVDQRGQLDAWLAVPDGTRHSPLDRLRRGPTRLSSTALVTALRRYEEIRAVGIGQLQVSRIPPARLHTLARYAATTWAPTIARMPSARRMATLVAFAHTYETVALDDALDLLDMLITEIATQATRLGKKQRLRTLRDLDQAALTLRDVCVMLFEDSEDDQTLRQRLFARFSKDQVQQALTTVENLARPAEENYEQELVERYHKVRRFLPSLFHSVQFHATPSGRPVLQALHFLQQIEGRRKPDLSDAPRAVISSAWKRLVIDATGQIDRAAYTLCVLERLQDSLRRRDVYVPASSRWGDPRTKLLQGTEWTSKRAQVCRSLGRSTHAAEEIQQLTRYLHDAYQRTASHLASNPDVRIEQVKGRPRLVLTGLDKLEEPPSLVTLRERVAELLPRIDLSELLLEIHTHTGFAQEFTHISEGRARAEELPTSLCAVLVAEACNVGLEPVVQSGHPALTRNRLSWVQQNYFRAETLTRANARLVDHQATIPLAQVWGGGEVASADGLRFVTPVRTLNSGPNPKYFGHGRGITYYNFTSDQLYGLSWHCSAGHFAGFDFYFTRPLGTTDESAPKGNHDGYGWG